MRRKFNWQPFLDKYSIPYVTTGKNVGRGEINIRCPFCGSADPSEHMGLNKTTGYWACWRNSEHRGKSPVRLIRALLNCSASRAREIAGLQVQDLSKLGSVLKDLKQGVAVQDRTKKLQMPASFKDITDTGVRKRFLDYLMSRGWSRYKAMGIAHMYGLKCCLVGRWAHRIIIPVYMDGRLVTWVGRTTVNDMRRYLALSTTPDDHDPTQPVATTNIKDTLFNYDELIKTGGEVLYICEGSFDAMNIDWHGHSRKYPVRATALWSADISEQQVYLLQELSKHFARVVVLLDQAALSNAMRVQARLSHAGVSFKTLTQAKDPGEMTRAQLVNTLFIR